MLNLFRWLTSQNSSRKTKGLKLKQDAINLLDLQSGATLYFFPAKDWKVPLSSDKNSKILLV